MGLLDHYRRFEGLSDQEVSADLRAKADARKAEALERVEPIDLSRTTWPGLPHHQVVNAITYAARKGLNRYVDPRAGALRTEIANHHGLDPGQIVVGNGSAQLMGSAASALLEPGDELITPWPSYPLYPQLARRSHGQAIAVPGFSAEGILRAVTERTRVVTLCNPNDPTGELLGADALDGLLRSLPERVVTFVDEALVDYVDAQAVDANLPLLAAHPRLLIFRTFSKAWGLAGLRCGYALGAPDSGPLLEQLEPDLGVNDLAQEGALEALRSTEARVRGRAQTVAEQRAHVLAALGETPYEAEPSQANVLWLRLPGVEGAELAARLERQGVMVQAGAAIGAPDRIRASVHLREHAVRLVHALEQALEEEAGSAARS